MFLRNFSRLVALPHSVFALPFAVSGYLFAWKSGPITTHWMGEWGRLVLVVCALVFARTAAMAFNRLLDAEIDAKNPRTSQREIPSGKISKRQAVLVTGGATGLFLLVCGALGEHCLILSPLVLVVLFGYSLTKRFTPYSHLVLGLALALAPGGAWWVLRPQIEAAPLILMLAVLLWVSGFDVLYSCQDVLFDRQRGLYSIPAAFGIERALGISTIMHLAALLAFLEVGQFLSLQWQYFGALICFGAVLIGQHLLIRPYDLSRINHAFFTANGFLSLFYLFAAAVPNL